MNPNTQQPTGQSPVPELNPTPEVPVVPIAPVEPIVPLAPIAPITPIAPEIPMTPITSSDVLFPSSPQPIAIQNTAPVVEPVNPIATFGSGPLPTPTYGTNNSNKKKLILLASIIGGVTLLVIVGVVLYSALMSVSKKDYQQAAIQFNAVSSANSLLTSRVSSLSSGITNDTDEDFSNGAQQVETSITALKDENTKLGALKAARVGEGGVLYTTFDNKLTTYLADADDVVHSVKKVRPALIICDKIGAASDNAARLVALNACSGALGAVEDIPNTEFKALIASLEDGFVKYAAIFEGISALTSPYGSQYEQYKTLRDEMYATQKELTTARTDFSAAIKKHDKDISIKDSANALSKYLTVQQR